VTFTAHATCGGTPQYQFFVGTINGQNISWQQVQAYSTNATFIWNTGGLSGSYYVAFWAENSGGPSNSFDTSTALQKTVAAQTACSGPILSSNPTASSITAGTSVTFTAQAVCGGTPQYQFFVGTINGQNVSWQQVQAYSTSATFIWNTSGLSGSYYVAFWAENSGGPSNNFDTSTALTKTVTAAGVCNTPTLTASPSGSPGTQVASVTFTAHATCGNTAVYQFFVGISSGQNISWQQVQAYSTTATYTWGLPGPGSYYVAMWAENQGGPAGSFDTATAVPWTVGGSGNCTGVTLSLNTVSTSQVTTTATTSGCGHAVQYEWWWSLITNGALGPWLNLSAYPGASPITWTDLNTSTWYVEVWVRDSNSTNQFDAGAAKLYFFAAARPNSSSTSIEPPVPDNPPTSEHTGSSASAATPVATPVPTPPAREPAPEAPSRQSQSSRQPFLSQKLGATIKRVASLLSRL
jgi:hypothetical protein